MSFELSHEEVRVLGSLIEKENTTPDYYPLTMNGLITACNQKSNREPVVQYDETTVANAIDTLRTKKLAFRLDLVDSRVPKYEQNFDKEFGLTLQEVAALCVLMLRGPQTSGEIRSRCGRIYPFDSLDEVNITLQSLAEREEGAMVTKLPVQPGRKEARYAHLLCGEVDIPEEIYTPVVSAPSVSASISEERIEALESEVLELRETLDQLTEQFAAFKAQFE